MDNNDISSRLEDFLEAIADLSDREEHAHAKALAEKLDVHNSTVAKVLQALQVRGLVNYQPHQPATLTAAGAQRANMIRNRHKAMKMFFSRILKLEEDEADKVACKVEHVMAEKVMSRFVALADAIQRREDCQGLRDYIEQTMPGLNPDEASEMVPLNELDEGDMGIVLRIDESLHGLKKFSDLGFVRGSLIQMEGHAPFGDLLRIKVLSTSISMRSSDAAHIWVKPNPGKPRV